MVPTIVIIDDDEPVRTATENLMRSLGLGTLTFASAEEFLEVPGLGGASCLIVDINMPGMNGLELQQRLLAEGHKVPVIFITGCPQEHLRRQASAAGAIGFLSKPFDSQRLIECIGHALGGGALS
jgi:FixJ family two-component response regulator